MLTKPKHGWVTLQIGDLEFTASYLTDVPQDFIDAFVDILKNNKTVFFHLDGESKGDLLIILGRIYFYAIECNKNKLYDLNDINIYKLMKEFIKDMEINQDEWKNWTFEENKDYNLTDLKELLKDRIE
jgi:CO dehydrogenase/acetyl-CoA synthase epsilon subunit